ncbi:MAG: hypothetical protein HKL86_04200, partial [Acidimicrobiaceae bacterium]|nr:hypothetical protein [Acidimicrobiaceae bacterium]
MNSMALDHDRHSIIARTRRAGAFVRSSAIGLGLAGVAALSLASCGTSNGAVSSKSIQGVPTVGVSVALQKVACTIDNSCVAVGASSIGVGPSSVGEYRERSGRWATIAVPSVSSAQILATSCWTSGCLIGGAQSSGDLLWEYYASSHTVATMTPPAGGVG